MIRRRSFLSHALFSAAALVLSGSLVPALAQDGAAPVVNEMTLGDADAPVTVIEYASYTCGHCRDFHDHALDAFKKKFVETGKVQFVYREIFFRDREGRIDKPAVWSSIAARCDGAPGKFFAIGDKIFENQRMLQTERDGKVIVAGLRKMASAAAVTKDELDACFADGAKAAAIVEKSDTEAGADGIEGTPTFVVNGTTYTMEDIAARAGNVSASDQIARYRETVIGGLSDIIAAEAEKVGG